MKPFANVKGKKNITRGKNNPAYSSITSHYVYVLVAHSIGLLTAVIVDGLCLIFFGIYIYILIPDEEAW